jgi:gliding motility-associated-like protein
VSYYDNQNNADTKSNPLSLNFQNTSNPQTIFARIENNQNSSCFATTSFQIGLYKMPTANPVQNIITCDDMINDGKETFDLTTQNITILGTQSQSDFTISYHQSQEDANSGTKPLASNYTNSVNPQSIYVRVVNTLSSACYASISFQLIVKKKPELDLKEEYSICEGKSISITAPSGFSSYSWSNDVRTPKNIIREAGNYSLTVTKNYGDIICETTKDIVVTDSNIATITKIETQDWTTNENTITVYATGDGDYEYSIDGINFQESPQFFGLNNGQYEIYVKDKRGCGIKTDEVFLLMYPKFFTPNGDGTNDTWHIKYSDNEPQMKLIIYDRYGKMITSYNGLKVGWDGKYNGQLLPSDDYWFVVQRENGKEYKGHFALKR